MLLSQMMACAALSKIIHGCPIHTSVLFFFLGKKGLSFVVVWRRLRISRFGHLVAGLPLLCMRGVIVVKSCYSFPLITAV